METLRPEGRDAGASRLDEGKYLGCRGCALTFRVKGRTAALAAGMRCPVCSSTTLTPGAYLTPPEGRDGLRLERVLGEGALGLVYAGTQLISRRRVTVRCVAGELLLQGGVERLALLGERATSRVQHGNLARAHEARRLGEGVALVAELADGVSFESWCKSLPDEPGRKLDAVLDLLVAGLRGLATLHSAGLLHLEVHPSTLWVCHPLDSSRLLDHDSAWVSRLPASLAPPTPYAAPELLAGHAHLLSASTDLYALGQVIADALTGQSLGAHEASAELLDAAQALDDGDLLALEALPEPLSAIERLLSRDDALPAADTSAVARFARASRDVYHHRCGALRWALTGDDDVLALLEGLLHPSPLVRPGDSAAVLATALAARKRRRSDRAGSPRDKAKTSAKLKSLIEPPTVTSAAGTHDPWRDAERALLARDIGKALSLLGPVREAQGPAPAHAQRLLALASDVIDRVSLERLGAQLWPQLGPTPSTAHAAVLRRFASLARLEGEVLAARTRAWRSLGLEQDPAAVHVAAQSEARLEAALRPLGLAGLPPSLTPALDALGSLPALGLSSLGAHALEGTLASLCVAARLVDRAALPESLAPFVEAACPRGSAPSPALTSPPLRIVSLACAALRGDRARALATLRTFAVRPGEGWVPTQAELLPVARLTPP